MQNNQTYSEIINLISTRDDLSKIEDYLDMLEKSIYEQKENFNFVLKNKVANPFANLIIEACVGKDKEEVIKSIKDLLSKIEFLEVTIAIDPTENLIEKISTWLQKNTNQKLALDIKVDQKLIGGATISYQGKFFDGSIKKIVQNSVNSF